MEINVKAMKKTLRMMYENTYLTVHTKEQIANFINEDAPLDDKARKELSGMFWSTVAPLYESYSEGEKIPNVFAEVEE